MTIDSTSFVLDALAADENIHPAMRTVLQRRHVKQQERRFTGESLTGFGDLDDDRRQQWADDAKAEERAEREERANSYHRGGFGL